MPSRAARCLVAFCLPLLLITVRSVQAQPAFRVADLNTTVAQHSSVIFNRQKLTALGNQFFFVGEDGGAYGAEIWRSDGTLAGTGLLKDVCPGACSSSPISLTISNGMLFFTADDGVHGLELWKSDGTPEGTSMVADIRPDRSSSIGDLIDADGVLFFFADDGVHGYELWTSDGTPAGTHLVKDIVVGPGGFAGRLLATSGHRLLFAAGQQIVPWVSDGTEAGTVMVTNQPDSEIIDPYYNAPAYGRDALPAPQGGFLFAADDGTGTALWKTDGTPGGTARISTAASPHEMTLFQGAVYFAASDPATGVELWKTDGTAAGTVRVKDLRAGIGSSDPGELTVAGARLFFRATDGAHGTELWQSDGTAAGTVQVADLNPGAGDAFPYITPGFPISYQLSALGDELTFFAYDGPDSFQLWRTNGAATIRLTTASPASHIPYIGKDVVALGGRLYFLAGRWGTEVWSSDGTLAGTRSLGDVATWTSSIEIFNGKASPGALAPVGDHLFFAATDGVSLFEPWKTDGTPGGTSRIASTPFQTLYAFRPWGDGAVFLTNLGIWSSDGTADGTLQLGAGSPFGSLPALNGSLFYIASEIVNESWIQRLWKTDGTPQGTSPLELLSLANDGENMVASGGKVFVPGSGNGGYSLWVTDGAAPAVQISGVAHGQNFTQLGRLVDLGGTLLFPAYTFGYGWELWKSDGTAAGTTLLKSAGITNDFFNYNTYGEGEAVALPGGPLFFVLRDVTAGAELWKSDGTAAGTVRVADILPGPLGSNPHQLTPAGNKLYFTADDGVHGEEPWVSDGTAAGTHMVADLRPGPDSSHPGSFNAVGGTLLFSAFDGVHGVEPWRTDGRTTGTRRIQDIAPGPLSSSPSGFTAAGPNVYFAANDNTTGFELWAVPRSNVLATFSDAPTTYWAWRSVEAVAAADITLGCGEGLFCTERTLTRAEMGVFLGRGLHGSTFVPPPATGTHFADVPASYWAADWIEQIATDGVTQGCAVSPLRFCPEAQVARAEMAIFLLRARHGGAYMPPPATGTRFTDVPASFWAAAWIEQLAAEGITNGCDTNLYCPNKTVGRAEMAVFLARSFNLTLP